MNTFCNHIKLYLPPIIFFLRQFFFKYNFLRTNINWSWLADILRSKILTWWLKFWRKFWKINKYPFGSLATLRLINKICDMQMAVLRPFLATYIIGNYINIIHKTEVQMIILRCLTSLSHNFFKSYDTKLKKQYTNKFLTASCT